MDDIVTLNALSKGLVDWTGGLDWWIKVKNPGGLGPPSPFFELHT